MDILIMIVCAVVVLGFLVFIHEGGHYLASRAFGVRVTEFMLGLPGPSIGFTKWGTKFGVTPILLGGYAKVCGMEPGEMSPHLEPVLAALYRRGTANMEDVARDCGITDEEAYDALEELVEWGSVMGPTKKDQYNTYRAPAFEPTKKQIKAAEAAGTLAPSALVLGQARPVEDAHALFESEYRQQYRSLPFWKRSVILVAGVAVNLLFAILVFILLYSIIGFDVQNPQTGEIMHMTVDPLRSIMAGFAYIGMVVQAVAGLFNPATAAETVSNSASIVGIAVMSKDAAALGFESFLLFTAMISVSLGIMNLLPIPPLDGGRFVIEVFQKVSRKEVSLRALNYMSVAGMILFLGFFLIMVNQDIQRYVFGNW
ncbi:site-2 protease family protein [Eggerthella sp. YY7918]|uniref:site-2 protease family protein n=1 Tax=Eggerthella sp. (strain YY7918) TaxID=502558 RepID=UPI0002170F43|nr:site-2 protease family protein [Eggerthella sp. YY7918]BAK43887.1 predicted membrane-associated Zn-dependent protease 1 [Eggerthella sp. YY7918]